VRARGVTTPIAIAGVVVSLAVIAAGVPLMYADGLVGLGIAFALGEAVALLIRGYIMTRFFRGVRVLPHLLRGFAPTVVAAVPVLILRSLDGTERSAGVAIAVFAIYLLATIAATAMLEWPLLSEARGYLVRRRPQLA
jgi:hypothetical protein